MGNPNLPEGVTQKDIDSQFEHELTYEELKDDLETSEAECLRLTRINRKLVEALNLWQQVDLMKKDNPFPDVVDQTTLKKLTISSTITALRLSKAKEGGAG